MKDFFGWGCFEFQSTVRYGANTRTTTTGITGKTKQGKYTFPGMLFLFPYLALERRMYRFIVDSKVRTKKVGLDLYNKITENAYLGMCPSLFNNDIPVRLIFLNLKCSAIYR
jgi:hypothetical protein